MDWVSIAIFKSSKVILAVAKLMRSFLISSVALAKILVLSKPFKTTMLYGFLLISTWLESRFFAVHHTTLLPLLELFGINCCF